MARIVRPQPVRLPLKNGEWLLVRKRLNVGEEREMWARCYIAGSDGTLKVNPLMIGFSQMVAYLIDWHLIDEETGDALPSLRDEDADAAKALNALDSETFSDIKDAIDAHLKSEGEAREQEKNAKAGRTTSAETSPSLSAADLASSTSVN